MIHNPNNCLRTAQQIVNNIIIGWRLLLQYEHAAMRTHTHAATGFCLYSFRSYFVVTLLEISCAVRRRKRKILYQIKSYDVKWHRVNIASHGAHQLTTHHIKWNGIFRPTRRCGCRTLEAEESYLLLDDNHLSVAHSPIEIELVTAKKSSLCLC